MGYVILMLWLAVWIGFAIYGFKKKWSGVISIGGGFFSACVALAVSFTVYDTLMDGDSDSTKQHKIPKSQAPSPSPSSSQSAPKQQQPHVAATTKKKCDTSKLTVGVCVMQKYDMYDGTTRFRDISNLMKNGNYSLSTRWEGEECYADVHVSGIANGNSYNTSFSCKVWQ